MKAGIPINAANMTLLEDLQSSGPKLIGFVRFQVEVEGGYNRARFYFNPGKKYCSNDMAQACKRKNAPCDCLDTKAKQGVTPSFLIWSETVSL